MRTRRTSALALAAGLLALVAYANAPANGFAYDDVHIVVEDDGLEDLGRLPERLSRPYWPEDQAGDLGLWRPLTTTALAVERAVFGLDPTGFHVINVVLHGAVTVLVVLLAASFVSPFAAFLAGVLFAVHPVHVEAVANVVGLGELLPATLYLLACVLFLRWTRDPASGGEGGSGIAAREAPGLDGSSEATNASPGGVRIGVLCALFAFSFLGKESAITLPGALVVLDLVRRPVPISGVRAYLRKRGLLLGALAATGLALIAVRVLVLGSLADPDPPLGAHLLAEIPRAPTLGVIWLHYARLLLLPFDLSVDYSPGVIPVLTVWTPSALAGVTVALLGFGGALWSWRRGAGAFRAARLPALALLWFAVTIFPVANVLFLTGVLLAERTLYLPSVGVAIALGGAAAILFERRRPLAAILTGAVVLLFLARTWTRTPTWASTESVFATLINEHPEAGRAQWTLGDILRSRGERGAADAAYRQAVSRLDSSYRLLMELGWDAAEEGDVRLGTFLLTRAWTEEPERASAPRRLAVLYSRQAEHDSVVAYARRTVALEAEDVVPWHLLAGSLQELGRHDEAVAARERVLELGESDRWQQWLSLARLRLTTGDSVGARRALEEALTRATTEAERALIRGQYAPF